MKRSSEIAPVSATRWTFVARQSAAGVTMRKVEVGKAERLRPRQRKNGAAARLDSPDLAQHLTRAFKLAVRRAKRTNDRLLETELGPAGAVARRARDPSEDVLSAGMKQAKRREVPSVAPETGHGRAPEPQTQPRPLRSARQAPSRWHRSNDQQKRLPVQLMRTSQAVSPST